MMLTLYAAKPFLKPALLAMSPCPAVLIALTEHIPWIPAARSTPEQPREDAERRERAFSTAERAPSQADLALPARSSFIGISQSAKISLDTNLSRKRGGKPRTVWEGSIHSLGWPRAGNTQVSHSHKITKKLNQSGNSDFLAHTSGSA